MRATIRVYDNGGKTADRYTALDVTRPERHGNCFVAIGFDETPFHPQGIGQHTSAMPGRHLGLRISPYHLPPQALQFVQQFALEP